MDKPTRSELESQVEALRTLEDGWEEPGDLKPTQAAIEGAASVIAALNDDVWAQGVSPVFDGGAVVDVGADLADVSAYLRETKTTEEDSDVR